MASKATTVAYPADDRPWKAEDLLRAVMEKAHAGRGDGGGVAESVVEYFDAIDALADGSPLGATARGWNTTNRPAAVPNHQLIRCVGVGGFGHVWLARHTVTEHYRACKMIPSELTPELDGLKWIKQRVAAHPNLFPVEEVGTADGWVYCLMPLAEDAHGRLRGSGLPDYVPLSLRVFMQGRGRLSLQEACEILMELVGGLEFLHSRGLVHGDIKPSNILRIEGRWALSDYGLMREAGSGFTAGFTPGYVPPEGGGTPAADMYALGVLLMMLVSGGSPDTLVAFLLRPGRVLSREGIDPRWGKLVRLLTAPAPGDRPTARQVRVMITRLSRRQQAARLRRVGMVGMAVMLVGVGFAGNSLVRLGAFAPDHAVSPPVWPGGGAWIPGPMPEAAASLCSMIPDPKISVCNTYALAIDQSGRVVAWGSNPSGMCDVPRGIVDPVRVIASEAMAIVLQADGRMVIWGASGHLREQLNPKDLPRLIDVVAVSPSSILGITVDGVLTAQGENFECIVRDAAGEEALLAEIPGPFVRIKSTAQNWLAIRSDASLVGYMCGGDSQEVTNLLSDAQDFEVGDLISMALDSTGQIRAHGPKRLYQHPIGSGFVDLAMADGFSMAMHRDGRVWLWGSGGWEVQPPSELGVPAFGVFAGGQLGGVVGTDGGLTMWGTSANGLGQPPSGLRVRLGDPDTDQNGRADWIDALVDRFACVVEEIEEVAP